VVGKQLSALLQILRASGVTRYHTDALTLELGPAPVKRPSVAIDVSTPTEDDDEDQPGDMRFGLERQMQRHFPSPKADPRRNKARES